MTDVDRDALGLLGEVAGGGRWPAAATAQRRMALAAAARLQPHGGGDAVGGGDHAGDDHGSAHRFTAFL
jgi:hypothetical protein